MHLARRAENHDASQNRSRGKEDDRSNRKKKELTNQQNAPSCLPLLPFSPSLRQSRSMFVGCELDLCYRIKINIAYAHRLPSRLLLLCLVLEVEKFPSRLSQPAPTSYSSSSSSFISRYSRLVFPGNRRQRKVKRQRQKETEFQFAECCFEPY